MRPEIGLAMSAAFAQQQGEDVALPVGQRGQAGRDALSPLTILAGELILLAGPGATCQGSPACHAVVPVYARRVADSVVHSIPSETSPQLGGLARPCDSDRTISLE